MAHQQSIPETIISEISSAVHRLEALSFAPPVMHVYNPLVYAAAPHSSYLSKYASTKKRVLFLGMNPGPWGMAQTGVPFGEIEAVRGWLEIEEPVEKPTDEHPKRPIEGFACTRSEVSGRRLWGLMKDRFGTADQFFGEHFIANYCPLIFLEDSGRNRTPDKLPAAEREGLFAVCDDLLEAVINVLDPEWLVGVGKFAEGRLRAVLDSEDAGRRRVAGLLHPSPANPRANRGWAEEAVRQLNDSGVWPT